MKILSSSVLATALVAWVTPAAAQQPKQQSEEASECPDFARGAKLTVSNTATGIRIEVTTPRPTSVAPLREATRDIAAFVEMHDHPEGSTDGSAASSGADATAFPAVNFDITDTPTGARVNVKAERGTSVEELHEHGRVLQRMWERSTCINPNGEPA